jgi:hypothetical protein
MLDGGEDCLRIVEPIEREVLVGSEALVVMVEFVPLELKLYEATLTIFLNTDVKW